MQTDLASSKPVAPLKKMASFCTILKVKRHDHLNNELQIYYICVHILSRD